VEITTAVALVSTDIDLDATRTTPGISLIVANIHRHCGRLLLGRNLGADALNLAFALGFKVGITRNSGKQRDSVDEVALVVKFLGMDVAKKFEGFFKS